MDLTALSASFRWLGCYAVSRCPTGELQGPPPKHRRRLAGRAQRTHGLVSEVQPKFARDQWQAATTAHSSLLRYQPSRAAMFVSKSECSGSLGTRQSAEYCRCLSGCASCSRRLRTTVNYNRCGIDIFELCEDRRSSRDSASCVVVGIITTSANRHQHQQRPQQEQQHQPSHDRRRQRRRNSSFTIDCSTGPSPFRNLSATAFARARSSGRCRASGSTLCGQA